MKILISGASIAGPALAFWLARHGHEVTVIERAMALRRGGYAVDIRGPALGVIERMGLRERLRRFESDTLSNAVVDGAGRIFGRLPRGFGVIDEGDIEILRGDLAGIFYDATREQVAYRFGESIAAIEQSPRGARVHFANGSAAIDYDLVVGADGVHSRTRALAFGPDAAFVHHLGSAMAIFSAPNFLGLDREQLLFNGRRRIASIKSDNANRTLKVCVFFSATADATEGDEDAQRELVANAFADAGWEFERLIDAMRTADDFYCDVTCQVKMPSLATDRVALIGDAGYCPSPLSGQGTSLALVGAYVLADALAEHANLGTALASYDATLRPFVERNQAIAQKIGGAFTPRGTFAVWSRNLAMRLLPYLPGKSFLMKMAMRGVRDAALSLELP